MKFKSAILAIMLALSTLHAQGSWSFESWINSLKKPDFEKITNSAERKTAFFDYLLPMVKAENNKIRLARSLIKTNQFNPLQIQKLAKKYRLKSVNKRSLLNAVDTIPVSLVLAQAAVESNWGRSRFSTRNNNYFGIWCFKPGCGVVPKARIKGAKHEVMNFYSSNKSIEYYLLNLNRHHAYKLLRQIRAYKREHDLKLTGNSLSEGLDKYSAIGYEYIELIQSIIRQNKLSRFD
ncbi:glucosaminidase domain-containing protein [Candidatus Thioglobus sp.]|uniref:glucosaminidase domain-containing protein n=2 Tax=Candidatus Thioglobus sp. TaxID=2026721 RepID=UPI003D10A615